MSSFWFAWLLIASLSNVSLPDTADPASAKPFVALFESRYRQAHTLQAKFLESYIDNGDLSRAEAGIAYFRRPGKMRFEYEAPEKDLFLVDGKSAWFYVPADRTVMRVPAKESTDWRTPLALLAGEMKVSRVCAKVDLAPDEKPATEGNIVLHCTVRGSQSGTAAASASVASPQSAGDSVFFELVRPTGELARLVVKQQGGIRVEFRFSGWRTDPPIAESLFHFAVPPGVAIVNGELPSGDAGVK